MKKYKIVKKSYKKDVRFYIYRRVWILPLWDLWLGVETPIYTIEHARETVERIKNNKSEVIE